MVLFLVAMAFTVQDDAAAVEAIAAYDAAFPKAKDAGARANIVTTLAQTQHEKIISKLGTVMGHADKEVRIAAAQGLRNYSGTTPALKRSAAKALVDGSGRAVNLKDAEVREAILTAFGALQEELGIPYIKTAMDDKSLRVASAAVSAAVAMKHKDLIAPLIELLRDAEKTLKAAANPTFKGKKPTSAKKDVPDEEDLKVDRAGNLIPTVQASLETLTGQKQPNSSAWNAWWERARPSFEIKKD